MPKYDNTSSDSRGNRFLKIPPDTTGYESLYHYPNISGITYNDVEPYYNPVKHLQNISYNTLTGDTTTVLDVVELPTNLIGNDYYLIVKVTCSELDNNAVNVRFDSLSNLPYLPCANTNLSMLIFSRIRRMYFTIVKKSRGDINIMIVDKYLVSSSALGHQSMPY